jgi:transcriptional regulator with XRE-family HTH domain
MSAQQEWTVPQFTQGDRMRKALESNGFSVQDAADYFGVGRNTISNWMHGRTPAPLASVRLWALWTGVPLSWLQTGVVPPADDGGGVLHRSYGRGAGFVPFLLSA